MRKLIELRQARAALIAEARAIQDKADSEKRALTAQESDLFDQKMSKSDELQTEIDNLAKAEQRKQRLAEVEASLEHRDDPAAGGSRDNGASARSVLEFKSRAPWSQRRMEIDGDEYGMTSRPEYRRAWAYAWRAFAAQKDDPALAKRLMAKAEVELRSMQMDLNTAGGFLVPPLQFIADLIMAVDDQVFIRQLATVQTLTNAVSLGAPTLDSQADDADWTSELAVGNESAGPTIGRRDLTPHPLAKFIKVSNKLLRAAAIDPEALIRDRLAYKFAISQEKAFMSGTGAAQPLGLFTASPFGISTNQDKSTGSATGFLADNLIDAKYALKPQYWPRARWLFHRNAIAAIRKLKDSQGQYLWNPGAISGTAGTGLIAGSPDRLLDLPLTISEYCPGTLTTGLYVGMLADFSKYWIVDALSMSLQRLVELFAMTNQTAFVLRMELDAMPVIEEAFIRLKTA
ncbi:MAG TPA: phage major capsid protein [Candidatus Acidoferrales bacterium]|nr:phage major capsid protein [Candidatus Acidoferrales bacterium]HZS71711.1 phage major capsid protein [Candidatus Acidoferrum sp.]